MAKAKKLFNISPGLLILPDGTSVPPGESFDLKDDLAENAGVLSWIKDGLAGGELPSRGASADNAEVEVMKEVVAALTADLEAANEQIAKLTADLEAATKPKG